MGMGKAGGSGGGGGSFLSSLQRFDAFPKVNEDFFQRTLSGGVITVVATVVMVMLFFSELRVYLAVRTDYELTVDSSRGEKLQINLDVTFPHLPCGVVSLDAMDVSGEQHLDVAHNIFKRRMDESGVPVSPGEKEVQLGAKVVPAARQKDGSLHDPSSTNETFCGSCYGSEETPEQCCNTCDEVRESYRMKGWAFSNPEGIEQCEREGFTENLKNQEGEGCNIYGFLEVNKVAGNFHFAPGKSFQHGSMHVHDLMPFHTNKFNMSHAIAKLSFGADFPGVVGQIQRTQVHKMLSGVCAHEQVHITVTVEFRNGRIRVDA